jgi:hypothetical protein
MNYKGIWQSKDFTPGFDIMVQGQENDSITGLLSFMGTPVRVAEIQGGMVIEGKLRIHFQEFNHPKPLSGSLVLTPSEDGSTLEGTINIGSYIDREDKPIILTKMVNAGEQDQTS